MDVYLTYFIAITAALLPIVLLFVYIYWQDKKQPEPARWLWGGFMLGVLSAVIAIVAMKYVPYVTEVLPLLSGTFIGSSLNAFLCASLPEEVLKFLMLWLLLRKNPYFDEHLDGIVYATCIGLGFASLENVMCLLRNLDDLGYVASMRALFAVPGHFSYAIVMGYYYSQAFFCAKGSSGKRRYLLCMALCVPILFHGIYDSIIMSIAANGDVWYTCAIIVLLVFCHLMQRMAQRRITVLKRLDSSEGKN